MQSLPTNYLPNQNLSPHELSRLATNLNALGVSDLTIQRILRHSDVSTTRKAYIKTLPQQTVDAMALFQATISKSATVQ